MIEVANKSVSATPRERAIAQELARRLMFPEPAMPPVHAKQSELIYADEHHVAMVAGIGSGKSYGGALRGLRAAYGMVGSKRIRTPNLGVVTAPTYPMLEDATMRTFIELAGEYIAKVRHSNPPMVVMKNGSEVLFRSTEHPERLRGPSIAWWWSDESALSPAKTRKIMIGRLRQFGQLGYEWETTTPRGRNHVWTTYVRDAREGYRLIRANSRENIYLDEAVLAEWEAEYSGDFAAQELNGEFVAFEGLIYNEFDRMKHIRSSMPTTFATVMAGVDWGFANPGVILVVGFDSDGRAWVVSEQYQRQRRIEEWVQVAVQLRNTWGIKRLWCDPASPDNIKAFRAAGLPADEANNTVQTGIQMVKNRLVTQGDGQARLFVSSQAVNTAAEFEQYQWAENRHGVRDEPVKANDHAMDALRYVIMGADMTRKPTEWRTTRYA